MAQEVVVEREAPILAPARLRRASWGAIFSGAFVTFVLQLMFTLLGLGVGIATLRSEEVNSGQGFLTGSWIWLLVTGLVSLWLGAWVAGRLCGGPRRADGLVHGIVTWSVSIAVMVALLATAVGAVVGGTASFLARAIGSSNSNSGNGESPAAMVENQIKGLSPQTGALLPPTGRTEGQQVPGQLTALAQQDPELGAALGRMEAHGGASKATQDRDQVVNLLTSKHNLEQQQASNLVNQWDQNFQQAHAQVSQQAQQVGQAASQGIQWAAFGGFIALFLGLLVSAWGGWAGTASLPALPRPEVVATPVRA